MSMILTALQDSYPVLAQFENPTPEEPPLADKFMELTRYFNWFVLLSGISAVTFAGGKLAWEKWTGGPLQSPKMIAGAMAGGAVATSAGTIMNSFMGT